MNRLVVWGTGGKARQTMPYLTGNDIEVVAFVDNDASRQGEFLGRPVVGPGKLAGLAYDSLCIASAYYAEIREQALGLGVEEHRILPPDFFHFREHARDLDAATFDALCSVPFWYHRFEILPGIMTPGICGYKPHLLDHPELAAIAGRKVLDIGAWDGPYTLELSRRGAAVTGFDIQPPQHSAFNVTCRLNAIEAGHICANVYDLSPETHGLFDIVLFFGVYYHLKNPLLAFENINAVLPLGGLMLFEGAILEGAPKVDPYWRAHADLLPAMRDIPYAYYAKGEYENHWSNWWVPNLACLKDWITSCGFEIVRLATAEDDARGYGLARKTAHLGQEHTVLQGPTDSRPDGSIS